MNLQHAQKAIRFAQTKLSQAETSLETEQAALEDSERRIGYWMEAQQIAQAIAQAVQTSAHRRISSIVTKCLKSIFADKAYDFEIVFEQKRGKTEAVLQFSRGGNVIDDPLESCGGGVVDVVAFALRLASLMLSRPRRRRFLALDEPFKHLSAAYVPAAKELLEALAGELGCQVLMITHNPTLAAGQVIELV